MRDFYPPILATKLLGKFVSGPHGDALIGDLIEQYREGRSAIWYWRQTLLAIAVCLVQDRALGGPAIFAVLLTLLLMVVSVGRHPSSLGGGLFALDLSLLSGYGAFSIWVWRQRGPRTRAALMAGAQTGLVLGTVLITSHAIEWLALFGSQSAQFVRGAGSMLLMLGLLGAAGSAAWQRARSIGLAVVAGLWCGAVAVLSLISFALTLNLGFEAHALVWLHEPFVASGMRDAGAFVVRNSLEAAAEILIQMPIVALLLSFGGGFGNARIMALPRGLAVFGAWFLPLLFLVGAFALWYANALDRPARPPFVLTGIFSAGIALCCAHPIWSSLRRHKR